MLIGHVLFNIDSEDIVLIGHVLFNIDSKALLQIDHVLFNIDSKALIDRVQFDIDIELISSYAS